MRKTHVLILGILIAAQIVAAPALAGTHEANRTGFFIGFGAGWGNAGADYQGLDADRENSVSGNFRLGWAASDQLTIGLETSGWTKKYDITGTSADLTLTATVTTMAVTYFPANMGLFLRGGVGVASGRVNISDSTIDITNSDTGLGLLAATGYEWRLTQKFALGPQLQYTYLGLDGDDTEKVEFVSLTAQLNWYW